MEAQNRALVASVRGIDRRNWARESDGVVGSVRALVITGDLTEWGKVEEWDSFLSIYGNSIPMGGSSADVPVFEMVGNHDKVHGPWVEEQVSRRHGGKRFYAWDWDDLHGVALGEAPDDEGLSFLAADLATVNGDVPVVLFFHRALAGPWSTDNWFDDRAKGRLAATIAHSNVIAIFHGHHHVTGHYVWRGIDVFKPGAVKGGAHTFAVARLHGSRFVVGSFDWDSGSWVSSFEKTIR